MTDDTPLVTFGLITDVHLCDKTDPQQSAEPTTAAPRRHGGAEAKLRAFAHAMNGAGVDFIIQLGDLIDKPADRDRPHDALRTDALSFLMTAESALCAFAGPRYHLFGNHDTDHLTKKDVAGVRGGRPGGAFSWSLPGVHFVALDGAYTAAGSAYSGAPNDPGFGYDWADANIPDDQYRWLVADLAANPLPTIVFVHHALCPFGAVQPGYDARHTVRQADAIRALLEASGRVIAVFSGHWHDGCVHTLNGILHIGLVASAAFGPDPVRDGQHARVSVHTDGGGRGRLVLAGHGRQPGGTWTIPLP